MSLTVGSNVYIDCTLILITERARGLNPPRTRPPLRPSGRATRWRGRNINGTHCQSNPIGTGLTWVVMLRLERNWVRRVVAWGQVNLVIFWGATSSSTTAGLFDGNNEGACHSLNASVIYINRRSANYARSRRFIPLLGGDISWALSYEFWQIPPAGKNFTSKCRTRDTLRIDARVRFIPDDVHVVVIIIIAFCIITIISTAISVIYSRSRACIMRRIAPGAYHNSPLFIHRYSAKTADDHDRLTKPRSMLVTRSETV